MSGRATYSLVEFKVPFEYERLAGFHLTVSKTEYNETSLAKICTSRYVYGPFPPIQITVKPCTPLNPRTVWYCRYLALTRCFFLWSPVINNNLQTECSSIEIAVVKCLTFPFKLHIPFAVATDQLRGHGPKTPLISSIFLTGVYSHRLCAYLEIKVILAHQPTSQLLLRRRCNRSMFHIP